jgi:hypothetical protein
MNKGALDGFGTPQNISYQSMVLIDQKIVSLGPNVDFLTSFNKNNDNFVVVLDGITNSAGAGTDILLIRYAVAGTVDSGSNYYSPVAGGSATASATSGTLTGTVLGNGAGLNGEINIRNVNDSSSRIKSTHVDILVQDTATPQYTYTVRSVAYAVANSISGFRLFWSGGSNFLATGQILIYSFKN